MGLLHFTLEIYPSTLREQSTSLNSVPCAYFRVSLRDCVDFGLVGFRFFPQLVQMMRAFVNETTARLRCVWVFVKLHSVAYVSICCLPHMAIMFHHERGSRIFFAHTLSHLLVEDMRFLFLRPPE